MTLKLAVDGVVYEGWKSARVTRSLSEFAWRFDLSYYDRWTEENQTWPIRAQRPAVLSWNSEQIVDGIVDITRHRIGAEVWDLSAVGRSRTGQLVDNSAVHKTGHWNGKTATQIISDLCEPYGVEVSSNAADADPFNRFAMQEGETVFNAIDRIAKIRAFLPRTTLRGVELFTADALSNAVIALDVDSAIDRGYTDDSTHRHSEYLLRATGVGDAAEAFVAAAAADTGVELYRPLVVVGDTPGRKKHALARAIWEANVRSGRGESLSYVFRSAINLAGRTYAPGQRYRVNDTALGVDGVFLCSGATLEVSEQNLQTSVTLVRPESYSRFAYNPKRLLKKSKKPKRTRRGSL